MHLDQLWLAMHSQTQNATLKEFKAGRLNTLFSTAVAEEGLDLKACQLVVISHCDARSYVASPHVSLAPFLVMNGPFTLVLL